MLLALALLVLGADPSPAPQPFKLTLELLPVVDTTPKEWVFVTSGQAFKTVKSLESFLEQLPAGTTLTWDPGCKREGHEPLLSQPAELKAFQAWCAAHKIVFVLQPSG